jgi:phage tail protein X
MWDLIAFKLYGTELGMDELLKANQQYRDYVVFPAGIVLQVPEFEVVEKSILPPWRR